MLYRVVIGDATQVRAVLELELAEYVVSEQGMLTILEDGTPHRVIGTWAAGQWRSIVEVESWDRARKAGVGENPGRRIAPRQVQAV